MLKAIGKLVSRLMALYALPFAQEPSQALDKEEAGIESHIEHQIELAERIEAQIEAESRFPKMTKRTV